MKPELAIKILELIPGVSRFDIKDNGETCVSQKHFAIKPYKYHSATIDAMSFMNDRIARIKEYLGNLAIPLNDTEGKPFIYAINSPEEGKMQICVNMQIFKEFDNEDRMNALKFWLKDLHKLWVKESEPYPTILPDGSPSYTPRSGIIQYTAQAKANECLDILAKLESKDIPLTSFFSFFSNMSNQSKLSIATTAIIVVGGAVALVSHLKKD